MKTKLSFPLIMLLTLSSSLVTIFAQNSVITYQGRVKSGGADFTGTGQFKFALVNAAGDTTYWSNDGSSVDGIEPMGAVSVQVEQGLFTVRLGDTALPNMTALSAGLFQQPALHLRIWFDDGVNGCSALSPTQPLTAVPYAMSANTLGTTDNQPLELRVNSVSGLRLEYPTIGDVPNLVGGYAGNNVGNSYGAVIAGGGTYGGTHTIGDNSHFTLIGGGDCNSVGDNSWGAVIVGGFINDIGADAYYSAIGGGYNNNIGDDSLRATIAGGYINDIGTNAGFSAIGGGNNNDIGANSHSATIAGGFWNDIGTNADYSAIGGGCFNNIGDDPLGATIAGGAGNEIGVDSDCSAIGGGTNNTIASSSPSATIGGGDHNAIASDSPATTIGGGGGNYIGTNANCSVIGGGVYNVITPNAAFATIPGGFGNEATNFAFAAGWFAKATHIGSFVWSDANPSATYSTAQNSVTFRASGGYRIYSDPGLQGPPTGVNLAAGGGSWTSLSDRNVKENLKVVDTQSVLDKVTELPLCTWNYKSQGAWIRHIGPMAQDFKAAFGVGETDTGITTIDADGVALAAIQGLNQKVEAQREQKDAEIAELKQAVAELKQVVSQLTREKGGSL